MPRLGVLSVLATAMALAAGCVADTPPGAAPPSEPTAVEQRTPDLLAMTPSGPSRAPAPAVVGGLQRFASTDADGLALRTRSGTIDFLTGVNVGSAVPGRLPAELEVDAETWGRWFDMISATGVHAIRIYTVQPPHFYDQLLAHNRENPDHPLYLVHGVWIPEELLAASHDLFDPAVLERTRIDAEDAVRVTHGDAVLPERQGYASGIYTADVSDWLVSWAFGIEMDPIVVADSDAVNQGRTYEGQYVRATPTASPTEVWLAEMLDLVATVEAGYSRTMPLTFSNWPTTDPLEHPTEPLASEDLVGIDANNLVASPEWSGGLYASYHAYPYYPDFQRYEPGIADYEHRGRIDAYAGYLVKLRDHHAEAGLTVMILEFGVPSSLGSAHYGSLGRDQGGHDEAAAMAIDADLLRTQDELGLSGGFVFSWQDEWFKRTWNTMDTEIPAERRQLWQNPLTNEASFGLVAMDPGTEGPPVFIDGDGADWTTDNSQVVQEGDGAVREIRVTHDEAYLYLRFVLDRSESWEDEPVIIGFDTVPGGNGGLPGARGVAPDADYAIVVGPERRADAWVRASNDYNARTLGLALGFHPVSPDDVADGSGVWNPQRLNVNRPLSVPVLEIEQPIEWFDLNPLPTGSSDPSSPDHLSTTVWAAEGRTIELRVPWAMAGLSDPSSRAGLVVAPDGSLGTTEVERLGITVAVAGEEIETAGYAWESWNAVTWRERPKGGLEVFLDAVTEVNRSAWVD